MTQHISTLSNTELLADFTDQITVLAIDRNAGKHSTYTPREMYTEILRRMHSHTVTVWQKLEDGR